MSSGDESKHEPHEEDKAINAKKESGDLPTNSENNKSNKDVSMDGEKSSPESSGNRDISQNSGSSKDSSTSNEPNEPRSNETINELKSHENTNTSKPDDNNKIINTPSSSETPGASNIDKNPTNSESKLENEGDKQLEPMGDKSRTNSLVATNKDREYPQPALDSLMRERGDSYSQTPQTDEEWLDIEQETGAAPKPEDQTVFIPKRYILLFMTFLGFVNIYSLRVNLNVAIVAMVNNKTIVMKNGEIQRQVAEFQWESHIQGIVLGSFYYGYWVLQIPGAWIAMKLGGTRVFGYGVLLASLLALITPVATRYSVYALIGVRVFQGLFLGVTFPTNHAIWSKWAPPLERSTLVTMAIAGCPVGNIIAIPTTGILSKYGFDGGWPSVFYFFGGLGILWYLLWELTAYQSPGHHPTISNNEKDFIENSIGERAFDPTKESLPWFAIMTSLPMWAIIFGHFGACWGYYTLFTQMPTYLKDIQHLDIKTMGFVAATPYILKAFVGPVGGISADLIVRRKWLSLRGVRALFYGIGCCLAGGFILLTGYCVRQGDAIAMLILGVGFSGLNATGYAVNHLDIGPRYAGVLMGISNTFATVPGFLSPMLTGMLTKHKKPSEWKAVFWITFIVYIVCVGLYSVMCSGEKQPWAEAPPEEVEEEKEKNGKTS